MIFGVQVQEKVGHILELPVVLVRRECGDDWVRSIGVDVVVATASGLTKLRKKAWAGMCWKMVHLQDTCKKLGGPHPNFILELVM